MQRTPLKSQPYLGGKTSLHSHLLGHSLHWRGLGNLDETRKPHAWKHEIYMRHHETPSESITGQEHVNLRGYLFAVGPYEFTVLRYLDPLSNLTDFRNPKVSKEPQSTSMWNSIFFFLILQRLCSACILCRVVLTLPDLQVLYNNYSRTILADFPLPLEKMRKTCHFSTSF